MLQAKNTSNNVGVTLSGDYLDFHNLYESIYEIIGDEEENASYYTTRLRVLGVCYDIRHAIMGDREIELVDNNMDREKMKWHNMITPQQNLYYSFNTLWPEAVFVVAALNDFIWLYSKKLAKNSYDMMYSPKVMYNKNIAQVKSFQSAIIEALKEVISPNSYGRVINAITNNYPCLSNYITQYLDMINVKYLRLSSEKRIKNLPAFARHLVEFTSEYREIEKEVKSFAYEHNAAIDNIHLKGYDYPENFEW